MTVSIRAHHLLCMLTYLGKGYTPAFVSNYSHIVRRLNAGEAIELVEGPDDICQPMLDEPGCHCHNESIRERDSQAMAEIGVCLNKTIETGNTINLTGPQLSTLREAFAAGPLRQACTGCEWWELCSNIAQNKFKGCRLQLPPK